MEQKKIKQLDANETKHFWGKNAEQKQQNRKAEQETRNYMKLRKT